MTISYSGRFGALLFRWKASLWKYVWSKLLFFLSIYYAINFTYRFVLPTPNQRQFADFVNSFHSATRDPVPISFLLGLYVVTVVKRWWEQFENIAWPDHFLSLVNAFVGEDDTAGQILRRNIARHTILTAVLAWRNLSSRVLKRFPTAKHISKSGLMTDVEHLAYKSHAAPYGRWFLPLCWIQSTLKQLRKDNKLENSQHTQLLSCLQEYRRKFIRLFICDWISIPLVYTQVATVVTYGYFAIALVGHQLLMPEHSLHAGATDVYIPWATLLQFLLYVGWLNVAEKLMHPFGEEDDDFELNYIIDRHLYVAFMLVEEGYVPETMYRPDAFYGTDAVLPHTKASNRVKDHNPGSVQAPKLPFDEMELAMSRQGSTIGAHMPMPMNIDELQTKLNTKDETTKIKFDT